MGMACLLFLHGLQLYLKVILLFRFNTIHVANIQDNGLAQLATDYSELCIAGNSAWDTDDLIQYEDITAFGLPPINSESSQKALGENIAYSDLTPVFFQDLEGGIQEWIDQGLI